LLVTLATRHRSTVDRQRILSAFILYVLAVTGIAGVSHRDLWPFSGWPMMSVPPPEEVGPELPFSWIFGVTEDGTEYPMDPRALEPLSAPELLAWLDYRLQTLSPEQRNLVGALLLDKANSGRVATLAGRSPGYLRRFVGPFAAPRHLLFGPRWTEPRDVPETPFTAIRWYRESWNIDRRRIDSAAVTRTLGFEYRP
jgi:hypothetical protein